MSPSAGALTPETRVGLFKIADTGKSLAGLRRTHDMTLHDGHPHSPPSIIHRHEDMRRCFFLPDHASGLGIALHHLHNTFFFPVGHFPN